MSHVFFHFRSLSYGAIGHVLGHELTHGFDTTGENVHVIRVCRKSSSAASAALIHIPFSLNFDIKRKNTFFLFYRCQGENLIRTAS